jgi:hypothetical protein
VWVYDAATGKEKEEAFWSGSVGELPSAMSVGSDGLYVALTTSSVSRSGGRTQVKEFAHVIELSSGKKHRHEIEAWSTGDGPQNKRFVAISEDGAFLACGSGGTVAVWERSGRGDDMTYVPHATLQISDDPDAFFLGDGDSLSFGGKGVLAAAWLNVKHARNGVAVSAWKLSPSSAESAENAALMMLNYSLPTDDDISDTYQNTPSGVAVAPSGDYVALCSWGTQERLVGQEQLQLFQLTDGAPVDSPAVVRSVVGHTDTGAGADNGIDHNKNLTYLRFAYVFIRCRSHYLPPHLYMPSAPLSTPHSRRSAPEPLAGVRLID